MLLFSLIIIFVSVRWCDAVSNFMFLYNKYDLPDEYKTELPNLLNFITTEYMLGCTPYILYDEFFYETIVYREALFQTLNDLKYIPTTQGFIDEFTVEALYGQRGRQTCFNYVILAADFEYILNKLDFQLTSRIVLVWTATKWQLNVFLSSDAARAIQNLLIINDPILKRDYSRKVKSDDIILYTHQLHVDGIGSSAIKTLTAWRNNSLTRPEVNLFPSKLDEGLNGHRLVVSAYEQPPFVIRKMKNVLQTDSPNAWDGIEIQLLRLIGKSLNITLSIRDAITNNETAAYEEVIGNVHKGTADIGISGIFVTRRYYDYIYFSLGHSQDCASFITLSSTAIPKYQAILGPFRWGVWVCIIVIYLLGVIPIAFSYKLSCKMFESWGEVGTMFWMIFGTFTNLFTFRGENSWSNTKKNSTRSVIGTYWIFTIIITAAYSSSIISFITIPTYFDVVDSVEDLLDDEFRVGTLDARDWKTLFNDTFDEKTNKLMKNVDIVNTSLAGLEKVRKQKRYAFLGSANFLKYAVQSNFSFSSNKKKSMYHITSQCLAPFMVSFVMKKKTDFLLKFDQQIQRFQENGLIEKITNDIDWDISRTSGGRLFKESSGSLRNEVPEDRQLTLDDMQGMFLLLGIGVSFASAALLRECWAGYQCYKDIKMMGSHRSSIPSIVLTPCPNDNSENATFSRSVSAFCKRVISASIFGSQERLCNSIRRFSH